MSVDTAERAASPVSDTDDPPHIGCRAHRPAVAFCGAEMDPDDEWQSWRGQRACPLCVLAIERQGGRSPCEVCTRLR